MQQALELENFKGRYHLRYIGDGLRIMLKWILSKQGVRL
jgi:hypothetical protein